MTQAQALAALDQGYNIFLTGPAGSGKTYVLNAFIRELHRRRAIVSVTASTGIAATHLNGQTIHAWSGIGIHDSLSSKELDRIVRSKKIRSRVQSAEVLIIDEISMLHGRQFAMVDTVCRAIRKNGTPFGGIQVVVCGDFFQLPPVFGSADAVEYVYASPAWQTADFRVCYLTEQHRQIGGKLLQVLQDIRSGTATDETAAVLQSRVGRAPSSDDIVPKLFTHNLDVDARNELALAELAGETEVFEMRSHGPAVHVERLKKGCLAPERLQLKLNARVMFVKNNGDAGYVNGTLGEIVGFNTDGWPIVETRDGRLIDVDPQTWNVEENEKVVASISQVPLRLAWAMTVHKSQGMTMDAARIDLSKAFTYGMGYVALSRVRSLDGLFLDGINRMALSVDPGVLAHDRSFVAASAAFERLVE
ncbi:MAG: AAA family ATPase [Candidatus Kerfeldbacteria bacterium]|nr:AAA family ATPase [Candidatus Kerfeldbacteria bacterium]